jgi:hypothetical protein
MTHCRRRRAAGQWRGDVPDSEVGVVGGEARGAVTGVIVAGSCSSKRTLKVKSSLGLCPCRDRLACKGCFPINMVDKF